MTRDSLPSDPVSLTPIGVVASPLVHRQDAPRQGSIEGGSEAVIRLHDPALREGLRGLSGFERIWVLFLFHKNSESHLLTRPPRTGGPKVGVFASRSPYRPGGIGMSAVRLLGVDEGALQIRVGGSDLLDGTPVLDIKPYIPYCDAFPEARIGWVAGRDTSRTLVRFTSEAMRRLVWVKGEGGPSLALFARRELSYQPEDNGRKRIYRDPVSGDSTLAYRTWRLPYRVSDGVVTVSTLKSSYTDAELEDAADPFGDRDIHQKFISRFPGSRDPRG